MRNRRGRFTGRQRGRVVLLPDDPVRRRVPREGPGHQLEGVAQPDLVHLGLPGPRPASTTRSVRLSDLIREGRSHPVGQSGCVEGGLDGEEPPRRRAAHRGLGP